VLASSSRDGVPNASSTSRALVPACNSGCTCSREIPGSGSGAGADADCCCGSGAASHARVPTCGATFRVAFPCCCCCCGGCGGCCCRCSCPPARGWGGGVRGGRRGGVVERRAGSRSWAGGSICQLCRQTRSLASRQLCSQTRASLRWGAATFLVMAAAGWPRRALRAAVRCLPGHWPLAGHCMLATPAMAGPHGRT
jgi:hypothetical protein